MHLQQSVGRTLLTQAEELSLMTEVEDYRFLKGASAQLRTALKREPTLQEWAMTVMTDTE